jgi:hypothetical protein
MRLGGRQAGVIRTCRGFTIPGTQMSAMVPRRAAVDNLQLMIATTGKGFWHDSGWKGACRLGHTVGECTSGPVMGNGEEGEYKVSSCNWFSTPPTEPRCGAVVELCNNPVIPDVQATAIRPLTRHSSFLGLVVRSPDRAGLTLSFFFLCLSSFRIRDLVSLCPSSSSNPEIIPLESNQHMLPLRYIQVQNRRILLRHERLRACRFAHTCQSSPYPPKHSSSSTQQLESPQ